MCVKRKSDVTCCSSRLSCGRNQSLVGEVLELCRTGDWEVVREKTAESKDYIIRILITGILHREFSTDFQIIHFTRIEG